MTGVPQSGADQSCHWLSSDVWEETSLWFKYNWTEGRRWLVSSVPVLKYVDMYSASVVCCRVMDYVCSCMNR